MSVIIAIDAGHGQYTSGKRCMKSLDSKETREWFLNDRIADKVQTMLGEYEDVVVVRTDDSSGLKDVPLATRVKTANNAKADMFISIHHNAGVNGKKSGGTVVYYSSSNTERKTQAKQLYDELVSKTNLIGDRYEKVIKKGFYVIANTKMPSFLIENGFMDSSTDVPIILSEEHANKSAEGIVNFVVKQYNLKRKDDAKTEAKETTLIEPIIMFKVKINTKTLNVREQPNVNSTIKGVVTKGEVFTITETSKDGKWGRLKSKLGWINLAYTEISK